MKTQCVGLVAGDQSWDCPTTPTPATVDRVARRGTVTLITSQACVQCSNGNVRGGIQLMGMRGLVGRHMGCRRGRG
jgi:hypothetical protein